MTTFELTDEQNILFDEWKTKLEKEYGECYVGAAGGAYMFCFIPTGLGIIVEAKRADGHSINLTDFDNC